MTHLNLPSAYGGFLFLAEDARGIPWLSPHQHEELELNVVLSGTVTYVISKRRYTFQSGDLFWLFPAQVHHAINRSADSKYYVASFKPSLIQSCATGPKYQALSKKRCPSSLPLHCTLSPALFTEVCQLMNHALRDGLDPDTLNHEAGYGLSPGFQYTHRDPDLLNATLTSILLLCWNAQLELQKASPSSLLHQSIFKAIELLRPEKEPLSLTDLATKSGASKAHLSRLFNLELGISISAYRNSLRLDRAWQLLHSSTSHLNLTELAYKSGFNSYATFYRVCYATYGRDPKDVFKIQAKTATKLVPPA